MVVEVQGVADLVSDILELSDDVKEDKKTHKEAATPVLKSARGKPARVSGLLKKSGRKGATKTEGNVKFGNRKTPYAAPYHFGDASRPQGGYMRPDPFLYEAADERIGEVVKAYEDRLLVLTRRF